MSGSLGDGGINASIPLQAGQGVAQPPNPLQQVGQFADVANSLNALKLFPGQQQLQQQALQLGGVGVQQAQLDFANHQRQITWNGLVPLLQMANPTHADLTSALGAMEADGIVTQGGISDLMQGLPTGDGPDFVARLRANIAANSQSNPVAAVENVTPQSTTILNGAQIQPALIAPPGSTTPGAISPIGGSYPMQMTPEQSNQLVQVWNPQTQQFDYIPRAQVAPTVNGAEHSWVALHRPHQ